MLRKDIKTDKPVMIRVGGITLSVLRIGERVVKLGVDAPREMEIEFLDIVDGVTPVPDGGAGG